MTTRQRQLRKFSSHCIKTNANFLKCQSTGQIERSKGMLMRSEMGGVFKPLLISFLISQAVLVQAQPIDLSVNSSDQTYTDTSFGRRYLINIGTPGNDVTIRGSFDPAQNLRTDPNNPGGTQGFWALLTLSHSDQNTGPFSLNLSNLQIPALPPGTPTDAHLTISTVVLTDGNANSNKLTIDGAASDLSGVGNIYGAFSSNGSASDNSITGNDLELGLTGAIYGGASYRGETNRNSVTMSGTINRFAVIGGQSDVSNAAENSINLTGTGNIDNMWGGRALGGYASLNTVDLSYTGSIGTVYGGEGGQSAIGNVVKLHPQNTSTGELVIRDGLYGGVAHRAHGNSIEIEQGTNVRIQYVYGGRVTNTPTGGPISASANSVAIYGGSYFTEVAGGNGLFATGSGQANNNKVTIDASSVSITDSVIGGKAHTANLNQVIFKQAKADKVYGGFTTVDGETADNNLVSVKNATANLIAGGMAGQNASGNQVFLNSATISTGGKVYGGYVYAAKGENASQNLVYVTGNTTVDGDVYGAFSENPNVQTISQNSVTLDGNVRVTGGVYAAAVAGQGNIGDKNELVFRGKTSAGTIGGFTDLHLLVSEENLLTNNDEYVLTLTGKNSLDLTGKNIDVYDFRNGASTPNGEKFGLIKVASTVGGAPAIQLGGKVTLHNTFVDKNWDVKNGSAGELYLQGEKLIIQPSDPNNPGGSVVITPNTEANVNSQSLSQNRLSSIASANQSAQFAADSGLNAMKDQLYGKNWFFAGEGGMNKYGHGFNKIELNGGSVITGMMNNFDGTLLGGFFEASWGHAGSKESVFSAKSNIQSYGIGVLASREIYPNWEVDGSLRFGWMRNSFKGRYFDVDGSADFKTNMAYVSGHIGTAYNFSVSDETTISPYARYIVSYLGSDKVNAGSVEEDLYKANATVSHTLRAGVKVKTQISENFKFVGGIAIDETMGAKAKGHVSGYDLKTLSVNGTTAVGELKLQAVPSSTSPWKVDIGVKGYVGKRRGLTGDASISYRF